MHTWSCSTLTVASYPSTTGGNPWADYFATQGADAHRVAPSDILLHTNAMETAGEVGRFLAAAMVHVASSGHGDDEEAWTKKLEAPDCLSWW